jgi:hypothetical protein
MVCDNEFIINSVEDTFNIVRMIRDKAKESEIKHPFFEFNTINPRSYFTDIWYRGEDKLHSKPLTPKIFREDYDETSIMSHVPTFVRELQTIENDFDKLYYMQHYGVPTRLLDWTDNILVALYFAVDSNTKEDGRLYILNSRLLNRCTGLRKGNRNILNDKSFGAKARFYMIESDNRTDWEEKIRHETGKDVVSFFKDILLIDNFLNTWPIENILELTLDQVRSNSLVHPDLFSTPVALRPNRSNPRIFQQSGLFTFHGGKQFNDDSTRVQDGKLPVPRNLLNLNTAGHFLLEYVIPANRKDIIKNDLQAIQIHEGKLFPELEKQKEFINLTWLTKDKGYGKSN